MGESNAAPLALVAHQKVWAQVAGSGKYTWEKAEVVSWSAQQATVQLEATGKEVQVPSASCFLRNTEDATFENAQSDLTQMDYLNLPCILDTLKARYEGGSIYTASQSILISINPFKRLPLYTPSVMKAYLQENHKDPHVYVIARDAFHHMRREDKRQSILVSGESGAGKTEATKVVMQFLAFMGHSVAGDTHSGDGATGKVDAEKKVLQSNPVLEAFGNAKTSRNDNSSRFGKYIEMFFNKAGTITCARIRTYLLERSRLVQIRSPERSYHIFYQVCASAKTRERYDLDEASKFHYLGQSNCTTISVDDEAELQITEQALSDVGFSEEEQEAILRVVAIILHLGNVQFERNSEDQETATFTGASAKHVDKVAELLGLDRALLSKVLGTRRIVTRSESITKAFNVDEAVQNRDTLTKLLYVSLFDYLVARLNVAIGLESADMRSTSAMQSIGILDIYGFESFKLNSLEQLCINLTNEHLQQHFNAHVLKSQQDEYTEEKIEWSYVSFVDNQDVLELIQQAPDGVLPLLDEQCRLPSGTDKGYIENLKARLGKHPRFSFAKRDPNAFNITHFAGDVTYSGISFLEKNKDYVIPEHMELLGDCGFELVKSFQQQPDSNKQTDGSPQRTGRQFSSVTNRFQKELLQLVHDLTQTDPHYIRCVKPNELSAPMVFSADYIADQLRCGGVLEAVRVLQAGFPTKRTYEAFCQAYYKLINLQALAPPRNYELNKKMTTQILHKQGITDYQLGLTKVFLRAGQLAALETRKRHLLNESATVIQRHVRGFVQRQRYKVMCSSALIIQKCYRGMQGRHAASARRAEVEDARRREHATNIIIKWVRMWRVRRTFMELRNAAIVFQKFARRRREMLAYQKVLAESQQLSSLVEAKLILEARVEEWRNKAQQEATRNASLEAQMASLQAAAAASQSAALISSLPTDSPSTYAESGAISPDGTDNVHLRKRIALLENALIQANGSAQEAAKAAQNAAEAAMMAAEAADEISMEYSDDEYYDEEYESGSVSASEVSSKSGSTQRTGSFIHPSSATKKSSSSRRTSAVSRIVARFRWRLAITTVSKLQVKMKLNSVLDKNNSPRTPLIHSLGALVTLLGNSSAGDLAFEENMNNLVSKASKIQTISSSLKPPGDADGDMSTRSNGSLNEEEARRRVEAALEEKRKADEDWQQTLANIRNKRRARRDSMKKSSGAYQPASATPTDFDTLLSNGTLTPIPASPASSTSSQVSDNSQNTPSSARLLDVFDESTPPNHSSSITSHIAVE
mmetsp:Transcript_9751/g.35721  ORF Transcript_9751/g.35721 Transcript_9751/m.35721 type:complete len:1269 (+) Transcript_9751:297-4103(+)|eukprot:scaffold1318_cov388-Prasinococcus_capsulatus_cf.AAC.49